MMHEIITIEGEDPRMTAIMCSMRPAKPIYGLGCLEQENDLIPDCRFLPIPSNCKQPTVMEMHKFFSLMNGCLKSEISAQWIKAMLNWDLYTNPQTDEFDQNYTSVEKKQLFEDWKHYMEMNNTWISFYSWKYNISPLNVFTGSTSTSASKHAWTALDGSKVETPTTFPPYRGIVIGENQNAAKAIPLV